MSDNLQPRVDRALGGLTHAVRDAVTPPPPAEIRARAEHRAVPRTAALAMAVGVLLAAAAGVFIVMRGNGAGPVVNLTPAPPPSAVPSASGPPARPSRPVTSPPVAPPIDPIAAVDWRNATITVPRSPDPNAKCPTGQVRLAGGQSQGWPRIHLGDVRAVGDLTGDGRAEAVLWASCEQSEEDSGDGTDQLLVVTRGSGGALTGLAWVGPRGALFPNQWVSDGTLFVEAHPWHSTDWGYLLGTVLSYRWDGARFSPVANDYRGLEPAAGQPPTPIDLAPVADRLECPRVDLRLEGFRNLIGLVTTIDGYDFDFKQPSAPDDEAHVVDLAGDGRRRLLVGFSCYPSGTDRSRAPTRGVLVVEPAAAGFRAIDFVPVDPEASLHGWEFARGTLTVKLYPVGGGTELPPQTWTWNGTNFQQP